jgi:hypothetical protein
MPLKIRQLCATRPDKHCSSDLDSSMSGVRIEQKTYEMPPRDGFTVTHFITVADIDRSADFMRWSSAAAFSAEATARVRLGTFRSRILG